MKNIHFKIISVTLNQRLFCQAFDISCELQTSVGPGNAKNTRSVIDILTAIRSTLEKLKSNIVPDPRILQLAITTAPSLNITVIEPADRKCALNRPKASGVIIRIMTHDQAPSRAYRCLVKGYWQTMRVLCEWMQKNPIPNQWYRASGSSDATP